MQVLSFGRGTVSTSTPRTCTEEGTSSAATQRESEESNSLTYTKGSGFGSSAEGWMTVSDRTQNSVSPHR